MSCYLAPMIIMYIILMNNGARKVKMSSAVMELMGLVPRCRGQHRPDSPHIYQLNNIHTLSHVRIRRQKTNPLMQVRNDLEQQTNVNIGRIHHTSFLYRRETRK
jgi:hypothetical protein